jgi:hypothetical protein
MCPIKNAALFGEGVLFMDPELILGGVKNKAA